jgi:hypothetical protein
MAGHDGREGSAFQFVMAGHKALRHGRTCSIHPRLCLFQKSEEKTWMPGIKPGMTVERQ